MKLNKTYPIIFISCLCLFLYSCQKRISNPSSNVSPSTKNTQTGYASWYGPGFHGKKTASGEIYNMRHLTAAHKSLPFGTKVKVTRIDNQKSVTVTINDRGPFVSGRIIDLSFKAAKAIDLNNDGVSRVSVTVLTPTERVFSNNKYPNSYWVQIGYFSIQNNAQKFLKKSKKLNIDSKISIFQSKKNYRVCYGPYVSRPKADNTLKKLNSKGLEGLVLHNPSK